MDIVVARVTFRECLYDQVDYNLHFGTNQKIHYIDHCDETVNRSYMNFLRKMFVYVRINKEKKNQI